MKHISESLRQVAGWYELFRGRPSARSYRSSKLNPEASLVDSTDACEVVNKLRGKRSELLAWQQATASSPRVSGGRLLLYYPQLSLSDGAAELATGGFFDVNNEPPWDFWVFCGHDEAVPDPQSYSTYLLSWIPDELIKIADQGIQVNPERCLEWATESPHPFALQLQREGSLF